MTFLTIVPHPLGALKQVLLDYLQPVFDIRGLVLGNFSSNLCRRQVSNLPAMQSLAWAKCTAFELWNAGARAGCSDLVDR